jgi:hypothetical protein
LGDVCENCQRRRMMAATQGTVSAPFLRGE